MNYNSPVVRKIVKRALKEDIGKRDITTELVIPKKEEFARATIKALEDCVVCGLKVAELVFKIKDKKLQFKTKVLDGQSVKKGKILARVQGKTSSILTAERVALNFLGLLSGIATKTRSYVKLARPYKVKIMDTRKTIPGLRELEKYAVRVGGGYNHRFSLDKMVLIKDNHLKVIGNRLWVIGLKEVKNKISPQVKIEVEVKTLEEFEKALKINPDLIMLDNMNIKDIKKAVKIRNNLQPLTSNLRPKLEASGGITLKNLKKFASTGVDMISVGDLTHSVKSIDISLEIL
jgi:nicotinate-nucleotide pyrophosphorylase (carboxylating)